ncbi:long-chain acyl-CoA synthetase [Tamaricihabitans halophyticus]|uniref:Long-chain acyl-CoA synthetase n=1 Tax=Tamaricihabitans halophyticus TaxID=1262583 RepID=A0A4R2QSF7_9PSEU|nr:long-chain acyl-CoA synthetase [Tamaricihabitans halophyticus]
MLDPVRRHSVAMPEALAVRDERGDWTYGDLLAGATAFGAGLHRQGVKPGSRLVFIAPSVPEFVVAYLGIQAAGCVVVPMNTMASRSEIRYVLEDSTAAALIGWHDVGPAARQAADEAGVPFQVLNSMTPGSAQAGELTFEIQERARDDTAAILYTSGTTGRPKGAELTVDALLEAGEISVEARRTSPHDRFATALPLFHIFGQVTVMMAALSAGASMSLQSPFEPVRMLQMIYRDRATVVAGVPTMWNALLRAADGFGPSDFSSVSIAISGGASLPAEVASAFEERFGCPVLEGYGLTETTSLATFADLDRRPKNGCAGAPVPRTEVEIRAADGTALPRDEVGEVWVRGPSVMKGYWRRPDATAEALRDGWFRTGDLARKDAESDVWIVDRLKDLIIRGGYNVYPGEVEEVLYGHPDVVEAAVVGVPDDYYGEEVAAVIVLRDGAKLAGEQITAWARERMSAYKIPRIVRFVPELPKGATGKVLKRSIDPVKLG